MDVEGGDDDESEEEEVSRASKSKKVSTLPSDILSETYRVASRRRKRRKRPEYPLLQPRLSLVLRLSDAPGDRERDRDDS